MFCKNCGQQLPDDVAFCDNCGAPQSQPAPAPVTAQPPVAPPPVEIPVAPAPAEAPVAAPVVAPMATPPAEVPFAPPVAPVPQNMGYVPNPVTPQPAPKKKRSGLIAIIIIVVLLFLAGLGFAAEKYFQSQGYGDGSSSQSESKDDASSNTSSDNGSTPSTPNGEGNNATNEGTNSQLNSAVETLPPTTQVDSGNYKGAIVNNVYINTWAGLQFDTARFDTLATEEELVENSRESYEYGFRGVDSTNSLEVQIIFENADTTADERLLEIDDTAAITDTVIGGATYRSIKIVDEYGAQHIYVRAINGRFIFFNILADDSFTANAFINNIAAAY